MASVIPAELSDHPRRLRPPGGNLAGIHAKLRFALTALKAEHRGHLDPPDCSYLDAALADLERLAAG